MDLPMAQQLLNGAPTTNSAAAVAHEHVDVQHDAYLRLLKGDFSRRLILEGEELGAGNYGTVFRAKYDLLPCAVKVLHPKFQSRVSKESVYKECRSPLAYLVRHPNIVQFLDVQELTPTPSLSAGSGQPLVTLITELMDENLTTFLSKYERGGSAGGAVPWHTTVNICHDILLGLHYLHVRKIAYRILSSNNVLLLNGRAKISDLGVSRLPAAAAVVSDTSSVYLAPEAQMNKPSLHSDIFSFGVLLIQMITLKQPQPKFLLSHDQSSGSLMLAREMSRRKKDVSLIPRRHRLKSTALYCISDSPRSRPSSEDLCHQFEELKEKREYKQSLADEEKKHSLSEDENDSDDDESDSSSNTTTSGTPSDQSSSESDHESSDNESS